MWMTVCAIRTFGSYDAALMNVSERRLDQAQGLDQEVIDVRGLRDDQAEIERQLQPPAHEQQARQRLQLRIGSGGERHRSVGGTARIAAIREFSIGVSAARPASRSCIICGNPRE